MIINYIRVDQNKTNGNERIQFNKLNNFRNSMDDMEEVLKPKIKKEENKEKKKILGKKVYVFLILQNFIKFLD